MKKRCARALLCLCMAVFLMSTAVFAVDHGEKRVEAGETITLSATGSYPWTWSADDESIVSLTPSGRLGQDTYGSTCAVTGLRPGTTTVRLGYSELVFESGANPDWFGSPGSGENVIYQRTDTWTITVTGADGSTAPPADDRPLKETPAPVETPKPAESPSPSAAPTGFTDVSGTDYFCEPVQWAVANGITSGTSPTTFSPDQECTDAEFLTFLWRANGSPEPTIDHMDSNAVKPGDYCYEAVLWAEENDIGYLSNSSGPSSCFRMDVVYSLWKLAGRPEPETHTDFEDWYTVSGISSPISNAVDWAVENGITKGTSATTFEPYGSCTRGQIVTFLYRAR